MTKRLAIALLSLCSLLFLAAVAGGVYGEFFSHRWAEMEPWFGAEPDIIRYSKSRRGESWEVKAEEARIRQLADALHAEPCPPEEAAAKFATAHPIRLCDADGRECYAPRFLSITCNHDGTTCVARYASIGDTQNVVDVTAAAPLPRFLFLTRFDWMWLAGLIAIITGPTLLVDAWLLLLPRSRWRTLLWFVLPLAYGFAHFLYNFIPSLGNRSVEESLMIVLIWCVFSLLQSLLFFGLIALVRVAIPHPKHA